MERSKRGYRKVLTRIRWLARGILDWHNLHANDDAVGLLDEIDNLRLGLEAIEELATLALNGRTDGQPACLRCKQADPTVHNKFCQSCWEKSLIEFKETWKHMPISEKGLEELAFSFLVGKSAGEG